MTILECIRSKGMTIDCEVSLHRCGEVEVCFYNTDDGRDDATSFDINDPLSKQGENELDELFREFCKENNLPRNTVDEIRLTCVAESMDELAKIC